MRDWLVGPFDRGEASIDEAIVLYLAMHAAGWRSGSMIDVGAHRGSSLSRFATAGWKVYGFEPDPLNRAGLMKGAGRRANVHVDHRPVSSSDGTIVTFYRSPDSTGVSGLNAFLDSHEPIAEAETVSLSSFVASHALTGVDFLKIDVEGHDLEVLKGFPWHRVRPSAVLAEFEDSKTGNRGQASEMCAYLIDKGYEVFASEWHAIVRYGISHDFRGLWQVTEPSMIDDAEWGNVIAVSPRLIDAMVVAANDEARKAK